MKHNALFKIFITTCCISIGLVGISKTAFADVDTQNLIAGYGTSQSSQQALVAAPSDTLVGPEGWAQMLYTPYPTNPLAISQTETDLANYYAINPNSTNTNNQMMNAINNIASFGAPTATIPSTTSLYASCVSTIMQQGGSGLASCLSAQQMQPFANVDLNSLIGPLTYQNNQNQSASAFITAISEFNNPIPIINLTQVAAKDKTDVKTLITNNSDVIQYLNDLKAYAALQAVGVSNLNQLYAERQPTTVSQTSNAQLYQALNAIGMPNASQLQVENYMATRRITNQDWVASLSNDGPAALMRQMVILMAENLAESYNNRIAMERLTATMTAIELQQSISLRATLQQDIQNIKNPQSNANPNNQ